MAKLKIALIMIVFPMIVNGMQEAFEKEIEKDQNTISSEEKLLLDLEKIHKKIEEFWKKKNPSQRTDLTKSV